MMMTDVLRRRTSNCSDQSEDAEAALPQPRLAKKTELIRVFCPPPSLRNSKIALLMFAESAE